MTPDQIAKTSEHSHQAALFCWAAGKEIQTLYPELKYMFAIPNGGYRNKREAADLRAEGVKAGVPDIFLPAPRGKWHGLFVEMKRGKHENKRAGELSADQRRWKEYLKNSNYGFVICHSWMEAKDILMQYLEYK